MNPCDFLIKGAHLLTMSGKDAASSVMEDAAVAVAGARVVGVGPASELESRYKPVRVLGGSGYAVMPGLVNAHTHSPMVFFRGLADDMPLMQWLENHIWPAENKWLSEEFVRDAARLACLEMIRSGTTAFCDMYFFEGIVAEVAKEMGLRAVLTAGVIDFPTTTTKGADDCLSKALANIEKFRSEELITAGIGIHSAYACSPDTIKKSVKMGGDHDALLSIHLSETEWELNEVNKKYGRFPADHLGSLGYFDVRSIASHCIWLSAGEMHMMAQKGASVVHCPQSNLKLASGIAPVPVMMDLGINIALGTDGAASNNDLDMLGEIATTARLHKAASRDPSAVDAFSALRLATINGARALGLDGVGTIEEGGRADLVLINMNKPHLSPLHNVMSHMVYSVRSSDVDSVMVGGRLVMDGGQLDSLVSIDEQEILDRAAHWGRRIREER